MNTENPAASRAASGRSTAGQPPARRPVPPSSPGESPVSGDQMRQLLAGRVIESAALLAGLARAVVDQPTSLSLDAVPQLRTALGRFADDLAFFEAEFGTGTLEERLVRIAKTLGLGKTTARTRYGHGPQALPMVMLLDRMDLERWS